MRVVGKFGNVVKRQHRPAVHQTSAALGFDLQKVHFAQLQAQQDPQLNGVEMREGAVVVSEHVVEIVHEVAQGLLCLAILYHLEVGVDLGFARLRKLCRRHLKLLACVFSRLREEEEKAELAASDELVIFLLLAHSGVGIVEIFAEDRLELDVIVLLKFIADVANEVLDLPALADKFHDRGCQKDFDDFSHFESPM